MLTWFFVPHYISKKGAIYLSAKGGYLILDLKDKVIDDDNGVTIPGVYETLEGNYGKPVLCCGFNFNDEEEIGAQYVAPRVDGTDFVFTIGEYVVIIDNDDLVKAVKSTLPIGGYTAGTGITIEDGEISVSD